MSEAMNYKLPPLPFAVFDEFGKSCEDSVRDHFIAAIEAQASVVQQEPVADIKISGDDFDLGLTDAFAFGRLRLPDGHYLLYTHPAQQAKPQPLSDDRDERIAELLANEKVLLAQIQGHTQWREKIIKASEQAYGESAIRYKFSLTKSGKCMNEFPKEIDGRWFALAPAEDDGHIGHIARIAELEQRNRDLHEDVKRFRNHALNEKDARMALERELTEVRKDAERYRWLRSVPNGFKAQRIVNDTPTGMDATIDAAMKGQK